MFQTHANEHHRGRGALAGGARAAADPVAARTRSVLGSAGAGLAHATLLTPDELLSDPRDGHRDRLQPGGDAVEGQCSRARRLDGQPRHPLRAGHRRDPRRRLPAGRCGRGDPAAVLRPSRRGFFRRRRLDLAGPRAGGRGRRNRAGRGDGADRARLCSGLPAARPGRAGNAAVLGFNLGTVRLANRDQIQGVFVAAGCAFGKAGRWTGTARRCCGRSRPLPGRCWRRRQSSGFIRWRRSTGGGGRRARLLRQQSGLYLGGWSSAARAFAMSRVPSTTPRTSLPRYCRTGW